jgi:hypothetical protein
MLSVKGIKAVKSDKSVKGDAALAVPCEDGT